jgi:aminoglycoside phosphotransferase (APT) family kinase protein
VPGYLPPSRTTLRWVAAVCGVGASVVTIERLVGGITADVDRIVVRGRDGRDRPVVLRRWTNLEPWTDGLVDREGLALRALAGQGVGAPEFLGSDPTGDLAGVRCVLMTEVPGRVVLAPADLGQWLDRLAVTQARIHEVSPSPAPRSVGRFDLGADFSWISDAGLRRAAAATASEDVGGGQAVFAHGDYQHFNILWTGEDLSGVVDWTEAGTGARGTDVGHCRLNLAVLFSAEAAETYLDRYEQVSGVVVDPRADLRALMCWKPSWQDFIPTQVAGRAHVDLAGMPERVEETIRRSLLRRH